MSVDDYLRMCALTYILYNSSKSDVRLGNRKSTGNVSQIKIAIFDRVQEHPVKWTFSTMFLYDSSPLYVFSNQEVVSKSCQKDDF